MPERLAAALLRVSEALDASMDVETKILGEMEGQRARETKRDLWQKRFAKVATAALAALFLAACANIYNIFWLAPKRAADLREQTAQVAELAEAISRATSAEARTEQERRLAVILEQIDVNTRQAIQDGLNAIAAQRGTPPPSVPPRATTDTTGAPRPSSPPSSQRPPRAAGATTSTARRPTTTQPTSPPSTSPTPAHPCIVPLGEICVARSLHRVAQGEPR